MKGHFKKLAGFAAGALAVALLAGPAAQAQNPMPANKTAAIGNTVDDQDPNTDHVVLREELRVSSPADFILNVSAECSILTQLVTDDTAAGGMGTATTSGQVTFYVTIDGKRVPVAGDPNGNNGDNGEVVFCNREYGRRVTDTEDNAPAPDGQDEIADYIRTRQANAFQWLATNVGTAYDDVAYNGQNIIEVAVHARYTDTDTSAAPCTTDFARTCSKALVGKRTLIVEHTKASVIENTASSDGGS